MPVLTAESSLAKSIASSAQGKGKSIKDFMKARRDTYMLCPFDISIEDGFNARDIGSPKIQEHIDNLAKSITAIGLQRPLKIRMKNGTPILIDGECRLRAVIRAIEVYGAEIRTVEVKLTDKTMSDAEATLSLVVENNGLDLNALEKAGVFQRLVRYGWTMGDIAEKAGLSVARVNQLIELAGVPDKVKEMIHNEEIAPTLAWSIAKENDFDEGRTIKCIKTALKQARKQGRSRITARHVGGRPSFKASITTILAEAMIEDVGDDGFVIAVTREQFEEIQRLTKITI